MPLTSGLPDFKAALTGFYDERLKDTLETKTIEFKALIQENMKKGARTQKALITLALALFLLLALAYFGVDQPNSIQGKYLLLGTLLSYTCLTVKQLRN